MVSPGGKVHAKMALYGQHLEHLHGLKGSTKHLVYCSTFTFLGKRLTTGRVDPLPARFEIHPYFLSDIRETGALNSFE